MKTWNEVKENLTSLSQEEIEELEALARVQAFIINQPAINDSFKNILLSLILKEVGTIKQD